MVTTLIGDNDYLIRSKVSSIVADFKKKNDHLGVERISVEELDFDDFKQSLLSYSLFADTRLVILDQPSLSKQFIESIEDILNSLPETTDLIIIEPHIDKRSSYYKLLLKFNLINCISLEEPELIKWIGAQTKSLGGVISSSDTRYLIERVGDNQLLLGRELEKLVIYNEAVNKETIDLLTVESASSTVFQLLNASFNSQASRALSIYDKQRLAKVEPQIILGMFVWQLHLIAICLSAKTQNINEIASKTKLSPYSLRNAMQIANKIDTQRLKEIVGNLVNIDHSSKTISYDLDQGLKNFIVEAASIS